jgi:hypothetical protein
MSSQATGCLLRVGARYVLMENNETLELALSRRLPSLRAETRTQLAIGYLSGVVDHAMTRTVGAGAVPTNLASERADLIAAVSRRCGRLIEADEIASLLRVTSSAAIAVRKTLLAVYDDLPDLALRSAFEGAARQGRGSKGAIVDGYKVRFATLERRLTAEDEFQRRGIPFEAGEQSKSVHELFLDPVFPIVDYLKDKK